MAGGCGRLAAPSFGSEGRAVIGFIALILVLLGLVHLYLWKRLVRDPLRPGWPRRAGSAVVALLAVLVPATLIGVRSGHLEWLAWPGYVWIGLMFYLLVVLVPLEVVRLAIRLYWRGKPASASEGSAGASAASRSGRTSPSPAEDATVRAGERPAGSSAAPAEIGTVRGAAAADRHAAARDAGRGPGEHPPAAGEEAEAFAAAAHAPAGGAAEPAAIDRRLLLARGAAIFAGLTAAGITGYGMKTALGPPQLDRVQIPLAKLPRSLDGTRLAVVSDIHLGPLKGTHHAGRIVDMINSVDADLVCIVGDLVDGSVAELGRYVAPLANIRSRQGAYFVTGNHEYYSGFQQWVDEVARLGVRPLRNERIEIGGLDLAGVNDLNGTQFGDAPDFGKTLGDRDPARPVILMAHQPAAAHQAARYGVDLQVSGHTHGGQMVPFNLVVRMEQPIVSGFGRVDGVPVYVTNGAGFWGPPLRVGAPPQVTVIDLRTA
jgi:predicted MPP superfamily phosphohydrolase